MTCCEPLAASHSVLIGTRDQPIGLTVAGDSHGLNVVVDALGPDDRAALLRLLQEPAADEPARSTTAVERATAIDASLNRSASALRTPPGLALPILDDPEGASTAVFIVARRVTGVAAGVWRYLPEQHALAQVAMGDATPHLSAAYLQAAFAERAPVTLALTADLRATLASYPLRHYRTLDTDTGVAAQTLALVGAALGLASCMVAGYRDGVVAHLLRLEDGVLPTLLVPVGPPP